MYELSMYDKKFKGWIRIERDSDIDRLTLIAFERFNYGKMKIDNLSTLETERLFDIKDTFKEL